MAKIKRVKKISPISKNLSNKAKKLSKNVKKFDDYAQQAKAGKFTSLRHYVAYLKSLVKRLKNAITLKNAMEYIDDVRIQRARTQLRVYFLNTIKDKHIFRFVVKSSGLNPPKAYYVDVAFTDAKDMAIKNIDAKEILMSSRIKTQCSCDDFKYRFRYWLTQMNAVIGVREYRFPKHTNPNNEHMFMCKHQALVLSGLKKPAFLNSVFQRYINNIKQNKSTKASQKDKERTMRSSFLQKVTKE